MNSLILAAINEAGTGLWDLQQAVIISASCVLVLFIACRTIEKPHVGPKMPLGPLAPLFNNISVAGFIGAMSFGHIIGTLLVMGLSGTLNNVY